MYENSNFETLQRIANLSLNLLEKERFKYRQRETKKKPKTIDKLFDFSRVNQNILKAIDNAYKNLKKYPENAEEHIEDLNQEINNEIKKLEKEKESEFLEVKETIAIYQKHTTLGNVISVVLHEGRKPLSWYRNKLPTMERKLNKLFEKKEINITGYNDLCDDVEKLESEAIRMSKFFERLDPLASNKRKKRKKVNAENEIYSVIDIFQTLIEELNVKIDYEIQENVILNLVEEDLYMALTNIIENAIFWVNYSKFDEKVIKIRLYGNNDDAIIEIMDNGPGILSEDIKENLIFIPGYSRKNSVTEENGTGLGLSIAGEAIQRNEGTLEAIDSEVGAHFRICLKKAEV